MNQQQILAILRAYGINEFATTVVPALVALLIANPSLTDQQLVGDEDGSIKHLLRGKIGWAVDLIWPFVSGYVDQAITAAIPQARALAGIAAPGSAPSLDEAPVPNS